MPLPLPLHHIHQCHQWPGKDPAHLLHHGGKPDCKNLLPHCLSATIRNTRLPDGLPYQPDPHNHTGMALPEKLYLPVPGEGLPDPRQLPPGTGMPLPAPIPPISHAKKQMAGHRHPGSLLPCHLHRLFCRAGHCQVHRPPGTAGVHEII